MASELFNLDFSRWEIILLSLAPACVNFLIFCYSFFSLPKTDKNRYFSLFVLFLGIWQTEDGLMKMSRTIEGATEWNRIAMSFLLFMIPIGLKFILQFTGWTKKRSRVISTALFFPSIIFYFMVLGHLDRFEVKPSAELYWIVNLEPTPVTLCISVWLSLSSLGMLALLGIYFIKAKKNQTKRKQALLLISGLIIPILAGLTFEIILPLCFNFDDVPVTGCLLTFFSITALISIKKYRMLKYSPVSHWNNIVEAINDSVIIVDNDDKIQYANTAFCKLTGYELGELEGKVARELFIEYTQQNLIDKAHGERKNKLNGQYEIFLRTRSGEKINMLISGSPYYDKNGKVIGSIGIQTNITHLKEAENVLRHNESRLKQAQEVAHVGSWELSFETQRSIWSEEACKIYGIIQGDNVHTYEDWLSFMHPEDLPYVLAETEKGQKTFSRSSFKHRIICPNGTIKHIHSVSEFEFNDANQPIGLFGICHDITDEIAAEKALLESDRIIKQQNIELESKVKERTEELETSNLSLKETQSQLVNSEKMASLGQLTAGIAHEINNPINSVYANVKPLKRDINFLVTLLEKYKQLPDSNNIEEELKSIEMYKAKNDFDYLLREITVLLRGIEEGSGRTKEIVKSLKKFSYADEPGIRKTNIIEGLNSTLLLLNNGINKAGVKVTMEHEQLELEVDCLGGQINQVFMNVLNNAVQAMADAKDNKTEKILSITTGLQQNKAVINIKDTGPGIPEKIKNRIFEPFFTTKSVGEGTGLGLSISFNIIKSHKGEISVNSIEGSGTEFKIELPLTQNCA